MITIVAVTMTMVIIVHFVIWRLECLYLYLLTLRKEVRGTGNVKIFRVGNIASNDLKGPGVMKCNINSRFGCEPSNISYISGNLWRIIGLQLRQKEGGWIAR